MHRVLEHIDRRLEHSLDLTTLAQVANFSPFHFHRLFAALTGERLGDYVRRRRLEVGATRLMTQPRSSVLDIALTVGFGSGEAFARAFKSRFGCSPTQWRGRPAARTGADRNPDQANRNADQGLPMSETDLGRSFQLPEERFMNVRLIDRAPVPVAYLRKMGPYGEATAGFWQDAVAPWMAANGLIGRARYGISHDEPSIVAPDQCRYDACVEVAPDTPLTGQALRTTIPGGRFAVLDFFGTVEEVGTAWRDLFTHWLPSSGLQLDARPCFEFYPGDAACDEQTGAFGCQICIPIAPL